MWTKLDDGLLDHPKLYKAGSLIGGTHGVMVALGVYSAGLLYANRQLTDGYVPRVMARSFCRHNRVSDALVEAGLWERLADGGFQIHDFHAHNFTAKEVKERREWDIKRKALYSDAELVAAIRQRDQHKCRYCGLEVHWNDRRGPLGGQYDHVNPRGDNSLENVVVACRRCNNKKGGRTPDQAEMRLLPAPNLIQFGTGSELERN